MKTFYLILAFILVVSCTNKNVRNEKIQVSSAEITGTIVNEKFGGVGFHVFDHVHNGPHWHYEQVFAKRWRELNPSFVRLNDDPTWDFKKLDVISQYLEVMKGTNTEMYLTSWNTVSIKKFRNEKDYVRHEVDNLEYLKKTKGFSNIKYYCMTNELSLDSWASMVNDMGYFKKIQGLFYDEFKARNLNIGLLATDASPIEYWHTIKWASENMDDIPPQSLVVYTTSYDEDPPSDIKSLNVEIRKTDGRDKAFLKWEPNTEKDFCYYRIYRSEKPEVEIIPRKQIASTISNEFIDMSINDMPKYYYHIVAVDQSGNTSK